MPWSWKLRAPSASSTPFATPDASASSHPPVGDDCLALLEAFSHKRAALGRAVLQAGSLAALAGLPRSAQRALGLTVSAPGRAACGSGSRAAAWRRWLATPGHSLIPYGTARYPRRLAELADPPAALWTRGHALELLEGPLLAIVGSRHPTAGGAHNAHDFALALSRAGLTVVSGLAQGVDGASHDGALGGAGSTVAVLGAGIDRIYPRSNTELAERVLTTGLIVSEYPPGTPVRRHQFPARNRIIAALALGTLVVEATRRSGSLITARIAAELGREVFAVPGSIHNPLSRGCHALIVDGARLVESVADVLTELAPVLGPLSARDERPAAACGAHDQKQQKLLDLLGFDPVGRDELAARAGLTAAELSSMLLHLEMQGAVEALPGARYCRLVKRTR